MYVGNTPVELEMVLLLEGTGVAVGAAELVDILEKTKSLLVNTPIYL